MMSIGVDVGGTKIEVAVYDGQLREHAKWREKTPVADYDEFLHCLEAMILSADGTSQATDTIGIGLPCVFDKDGLAVSAGIPCINHRKVKTDLAERLSRTVLFENDVNTFLLSEATGGAGEGHHNVLGVVLGTGVGGGLCQGGQLYLSRQRVAFEFGHLPMPGRLLGRYGFEELQCGCGQQGCFNEYISGRGLLWMGRHFGCVHPTTIDLIRAMREGDQQAISAFNAFMDCLGALMAQLTLMYDPDVAILGGGLSGVGEIYRQYPEAVLPHLMRGIRPVQLVPPFFGESSGTRGAALLAARLG